MASKENKSEYADEDETEESTVSLKKRWAFGDDNDNNGDIGNDSSSSSKEEVSSEEEPA
jgi:hypothetical protein